MANDHIADDRKKVRLIDADAAVEKARASDEIVGSSAWDTSEVIEFLDDCPTVDAAPVVHGRCEYCKDGKSFIGARMLLGNDGKWHDINNCPNCGARMDGDGNG